MLSGSNKFLSSLTTASNWAGLANGIEGATVTGSPTAELLMNSYNTKNGTSLVYSNEPTLDSGVTDYDLYVPHTSTYDGCRGYWLASIGYTAYMWCVQSDGGTTLYAPGEGQYGVRPVISLPSSTECSYADGIWTVE